jgi:hypothetical protein
MTSPTSEQNCLPPRLQKANLRRDEASEFLKLKYGLRYAVATLAKLAVRGDGPPFHRAVRTPLYPAGELDRWATARLGKLVRSTSEAATSAAMHETSATPTARSGVAVPRN